jgi:riboflavin biosynthesis pyrimidine reductase
MEGSFTQGYYPDLSQYKAVKPDPCRMDFMLDKEYLTGFYAVAFDTNGKLGWKSNRIIDPDGDPGYDGAQIIEVLSENVDERYLGYLESLEIPYIFAGENEIDVEFALFKLKNLFGIDKLLLEGGSVIDGAFLRVDAVDELSLVVAPTIADGDSKPLFTDSKITDFTLVNSYAKNDVIVLNYKRR